MGYRMLRLELAVAMVVRKAKTEIDVCGEKKVMELLGVREKDAQTMCC